MEELRQRPVQRGVAVGEESGEGHRLRTFGVLRKAGIGLALIVALGGIALALISPTPDVAGEFSSIWPLAWLGFPILGALVAWRRPGHRIGLVLLAIGFVSGLGQAVRTLALTIQDEGVSASLEAIGGTIIIPAWFLVILLVILFPSGHPPSRRWAIGAKALFIAAPVVTILATIDDAPLESSGRPNPLSVPALEPLTDLAVDGFVIVPAITAIALVSIVRRWRRSAGTERLQYRWFFIGIVPFIVLLPIIYIPESEWVAVVGMIIGLTAIPAGIAVAVLRYRLYEIDRLISRSVTYTIVIGLLAGVYAAVVYLVQGLLGTESQLAVAGSTLLVAAAFNPLRRRVQAVFDRRFNRARFDAQREVAAFGDRLQGAVDLSSVTSDLGHVIANTVKPASAAIWIRN
jgi:hypothetical protein